MTGIRSLEANDYLRARDEALSNLDIDWARNQCGGGSDEMLLLALHKSRYEAKQVEPELRHARVNGFRSEAMDALAGNRFRPMGACRSDEPLPPEPLADPQRDSHKRAPISRRFVAFSP